MRESPIAVSLLVEDTICEVLARRLLSTASQRLSFGVCYMANGFSYIRERLVDFNRAAKGIPLLVLSDLVGDCPVTQVARWLPYGIHHNLVFRIAVKESEAWILADTEGIANFLKITSRIVPRSVDELPDPKKTLIDLASKSRLKSLRQSLVPKPNTTAKVGPDYNSTMSEFVRNAWDPYKAAQNSPSLKRALMSIQKFTPSIEL